MKDPLLIIPIISSFLIVLFLMPIWLKKAKQIGLLWKDMNKLKQNEVAGSGGVMVLLGFVIAVFIFVAYRTFYFNDSLHLIEIISLITVILLAAGVGLIDDLLGWQHGGLSKRSRLIMIIISSIPLVATNAGRHLMSIPFIGEINFGLLYPLILIPLGIVGATTTFNFLAGFNGLEAGQGIILLSALSLVSYLTGNSWLALINLFMVFALLAFLFYNFAPAKVFPGNVLTYAVGSLIAITAILGNFEKIAVFFFIPYILETILKLRGGLGKHSFGKPQKDGSLEPSYDRIYSLTHLAIWKLKKLGIKPTEKMVVYSIWLFQIIVIIIGFIIFGKGIF
ncbi:glycosyl transferase family 4 [Candidatus Pacearchaeota archaeon]|nr:glycosyl transferase family 4 [Candidatus Pacearchaeota archaeon]